MQVIRPGDQGAAVVEIRSILTSLSVLHDRELFEPDSVYDAVVERGVRAFQQSRGLSVTGEVNEETWRAIDGARWALGSRVLAHVQPEPLFGDDIRELQERLLEMGYDLGRSDGIFGRRTAAALASFQREVGLIADGACGPATMAALRRLGRRVVGGRPNLLRETERFRSAGPALLDKRIVIDPGHGGGDPGVSVQDGPMCWTEAELAYDLAARLEGRLAAVGMRVYLTRGPSAHHRLSERERASLANELGADLLISLHLDAHANPAAAGVATYHFGQHTADGVTSTLGERLAALVQREIVVRAAMRDCRTHPKTWDLLRLTRMPAVRVEVGYLTSPEDRDRLTDGYFRDQVAEAIVAAVKRMYLPVEADAATGEIDVSALRAILQSTASDRSNASDRSIASDQPIVERSDDRSLGYGRNDRYLVDTDRPVEVGPVGH